MTHDKSRLDLNGRCTSNWTDSTKHFQLNWFHQICPRQLDWTSNFFRSALCLWRSSQDFFNKAFPWNKTEIGKHKSQITEMFLYCALSALGFTLKTLKATWLIIPSLYWRVRAGRDGWDMLHWMPKSSNISTGESRPEVTSGTECIGLHSVIWLLKLRQEQQLVPSNRLEQRSNSKVRRQTWPGHGLGPFSTDQLHLNIS